LQGHRLLHNFYPAVADGDLVHSKVAGQGALCWLTIVADKPGRVLQRHLDHGPLKIIERRIVTQQKFLMVFDDIGRAIGGRRKIKGVVVHKAFTVAGLFASVINERLADNAGNETLEMMDVCDRRAAQPLKDPRGEFTPR
jgi:hypothetical protein